MSAEAAILAIIYGMVGAGVAIEARRQLLDQLKARQGGKEPGKVERWILTILLVLGWPVIAGCRLAEDF